MSELRRILWPTDFSDASREAAKHAFLLADRFGAELHALHVVEELGPSLFESVRRMASYPEDFMERVREEADRELAAALPSNQAGGKTVVRAIRDGAPAIQILDYAREADIDLIVIGTHGRTGLSHFLIGSVAERVIRHAECPVLSIRPSGRTDVASESEHSTT